MSRDLTAGQHALLETVLLQRQRQLEQELEAQLGGQDRVTHAREQLLQDVDGDRGHEADREVDLARSDRTMQSLRDINAALQRLRQPEFGLCIDCAQAIAFDRLQHSPEALRCISCQTELEKHSSPVAHSL